MYYLKREILFNWDTGGKISIQNTTKHAVSCLRCRFIYGTREVRQPQQILSYLQETRAATGVLWARGKALLHCDTHRGTSWDPIPKGETQPGAAHRTAGGLSHRADFIEIAACKAAFKKGGGKLKTCFRQRERKREGKELCLRASEAKRRVLQQNMLEHEVLDYFFLVFLFKF